MLPNNEDNTEQNTNIVQDYARRCSAMMNGGIVQHKNHNNVRERHETFSTINVVNASWSMSPSWIIRHAKKGRSNCCNRAAIRGIIHDNSWQFDLWCNFYLSLFRDSWSCFGSSLSMKYVGMMCSLAFPFECWVEYDTFFKLTNIYATWWHVVES